MHINIMYKSTQSVQRGIKTHSKQYKEGRCTKLWGQRGFKEHRHESCAPMVSTLQMGRDANTAFSKEKNLKHRRGKVKQLFGQSIQSGSLYTVSHSLHSFLISSSLVLLLPYNCKMPTKAMFLALFLIHTLSYFHTFIFNQYPYSDDSKI